MTTSLSDSQGLGFCFALLGSLKLIAMTPPLTTARVVLPKGSPRVLALVSTFLDTSGNWTLEQAASKRLVGLMDRLALREPPTVSTTFRLRRFQNGTANAAADGSVAVLQWWMQSYLPNEPLDQNDCVARAALHGHLHLLQWLQSQGLLLTAPSNNAFGPKLVMISEGFGSHVSGCAPFSVVRWLHDQGATELMVISQDHVAKYGELEFMRWLHDHSASFRSVQCSSTAFGYAAERGDLAMLQWLLATHPERLTSEYCFLEPFFRWNGSGRQEYKRSVWDLPSDYFPSSPGSNHVQLAAWLATQYKWKSTQYRASWVEKTLLYAVRWGNLELVHVVSALHPVQNTKKFGFNTPMQIVAFFGQLALLQWLCEHGSRCTRDVYDAAVAGGHVDIVQWIRQQHLEFVCSPAAMDATAGRGQLAMLKWLQGDLSNRCTRAAMDTAAAHGHLDVVQWLHANRSEGCSAAAIDEAAANGHLTIVQFLHNHRSERFTINAMKEAALYGHLELIKWLDTHRLEAWPQEALDQAALNGHVKVVAFLTEHCGMRRSDSVVDGLIFGGRYGVLEWLAAHGPEPSI